MKARMLIITSGAILALAAPATQAAARNGLHYEKATLAARQAHGRVIAHTRFVATLELNGRLGFVEFR